MGTFRSQAHIVPIQHNVNVEQAQTHVTREHVNRHHVESRYVVFTQVAPLSHMLSCHTLLEACRGFVGAPLTRTMGSICTADRARTDRARSRRQSDRFHNIKRISSEAGACLSTPALEEDAKRCSNWTSLPSLTYPSCSFFGSNLAQLQECQVRPQKSLIHATPNDPRAGRTCETSTAWYDCVV